MTEDTHLELLRDRLDQVTALTARTNKAAALVIQQFPVAEDSGMLFPQVRESIANVMAFVELGTAHDLSWVLDHAASIFDWVVLDCDHKLPESAAIVGLARSNVDRQRLLFYSDNQVWFDSALDVVHRVEGGLSGRTVLLCGAGALAECLAFALPRLGVVVITPDTSTPFHDISIVLGASQKRESIDAALVERLPAGAAIYDLGIGNLSADAADLGRSRGLRMYRLDNRAGISSAVVRLLETDYLINRLMGHATIKDTDIVAGGLLAPPGAVIVDDIRNPLSIFGVADGRGRFRPDPLGADDRARIEFVRTLIADGRV